MMKKESSKKSGFTLLELLIVIAIIAILSVVVVLFINPAEMLKKGRDVQRISDLATMKTAINLFLQDAASNSLGGVTYCGASVPLSTTADNKIRSTTSTTSAGYQASGYGAATTTNAGSGWIPVNFTTVQGGAPVSNLPIDPVNTLSGDYYYRYGCKTNDTFELDAALESAAFTVTDDRRIKDGGNSTIRYEVGTDLTVLPAGL